MGEKDKEANKDLYCCAVSTKKEASSECYQTQRHLAKPWRGQGTRELLNGDVSNSDHPALYRAMEAGGDWKAAKHSTA